MLARSAMFVFELHIRRESSLTRNSVVLISKKLSLPTPTISVPQIYNNILMSHSSEMCFISSMIALPARVLDSFMYCPFVLSKTSLCSCSMIALPARVFDSFTFMYCPLMSSKTSICCCLIFAILTRIFDSVLYNLIMPNRILFMFYFMSTFITTTILNVHNAFRFNLLLAMGTVVYVFNTCDGLRI